MNKQQEKNFLLELELKEFHSDYDFLHAYYYVNEPKRLEK